MSLNTTLASCFGLPLCRHTFHHSKREVHGLGSAFRKSQAKKISDFRQRRNYLDGARLHLKMTKVPQSHHFLCSRVIDVLLEHAKEVGASEHQVYASWQTLVGKMLRYAFLFAPCRFVCPFETMHCHHAYMSKPADMQGRGPVLRRTPCRAITGEHTANA